MICHHLTFAFLIFLSRPLLFSAAVSLEFILSIDSFFGFCVLLRTSVVLIMYMTLVNTLIASSSLFREKFIVNPLNTSLLAPYFL